MVKKLLLTQNIKAEYTGRLNSKTKLRLIHIIISTKYIFEIGKTTNNSTTRAWVFGSVINVSI